MLRIYVTGGALIALIASSFWAGYQVASGKSAKSQIKMVSEAIENTNQDKIEIQKHITDTKKAETAAIREIIKIRIKKVLVPGDCPLRNVGSMHNETFAAHPAELFL